MKLPTTEFFTPDDLIKMGLFKDTRLIYLAIKKEHNLPPFVRLNKKTIRFPKEQLRKWIETGCTPQTPGEPKSSIISTPKREMLPDRPPDFYTPVLHLWSWSDKKEKYELKKMNRNDLPPRPVIPTTP